MNQSKKNNIQQQIILCEKEQSLSIESKLIFDKSDIIIHNDSRIGFIGKNGCGKSMTIKYIYKTLLEKTNYKPLMVEQDIIIENEEDTILEFMLKTDKKIYDINKKVEEYELKMENNEIRVEEFEEYQQFIESFEYQEYDAYFNRVQKILYGLGIMDYRKKIGIYSGGWKMRIMIAKALVIEPLILIMDEPTNHLDLHNVIWLTNYLSNYKKCLIVVSHQIDFIDNVCNEIWYIGAPDFDKPKIFTMKGTYDKMMRFINETEENNEKKYEEYAKKLVLQKKNKKMKKEDLEKWIEQNEVKRPHKKYEVTIKFPEVSQIQHMSVVRIENLSFQYSNDTPMIYENIDFGINMSSRYIFVGANGVGKTTLFHLILNKLKATQGDIIIDGRIRIGYYHQQIIENLPLEMTPLEYLQTLKGNISVEESRGILARVGLNKKDGNDVCNLKIKDLSGGQKARVSFCQLQILQPHIIFLDEPTNHLDIETIEGLIKGINEYNGGMIIISHDIYFINQIENNEIYEIKNKKINKYNGSIHDYASQYN